jgi:hypothetical protein
VRRKSIKTDIPNGQSTIQDAMRSQELGSRRICRTLGAAQKCGPDFDLSCGITTARARSSLRRKAL